MNNPAWSQAFEKDLIEEIPYSFPDGRITADWAWAKASGACIRVGIVDSGVENRHPAVDGRVSTWKSVAYDKKADRLRESNDPHDDSYGHGTACAGIVRRIAPEVELISIKVLGEGLTGNYRSLARSIEWCIENSVNVINLSLGTKKKEHSRMFFELVEEAYFRNIFLVTAANNLPRVSYPSLFSSVFSVACNMETNPDIFHVNPSPPVEFGAPGINLKVAWLGGSYISATGNSFAAPHITGRIALILSKHPDLTISQMKSILRATAKNTNAPLSLLDNG